MTIEVAPLTEELGRGIINRNAEAGMPIAKGVTVEGMIMAYLSRGSVAFVLIIDGVPICAAGIINLGWKRGEAWVLVSPDFYKYRLTAFRMIKKMLPDLANDHGFRRVQGVTVNDRDSKIMNHLGFSFEGRLRAYGPMGQDVMMWSKIYV